MGTVTMKKEKAVFGVFIFAAVIISTVVKTIYRGNGYLTGLIQSIN